MKNQILTANQAIPTMTAEQIQQLKDAIYMIADANQMLISLKKELAGEAAGASIARISTSINVACQSALGDFLAIL